MAETDETVTIGCTVSYRLLRPKGYASKRPSPSGVQAAGADDNEITIVASIAESGLGRLAASMPLAKAFLDHRVGDTVELTAGGLTLRYEIRAIR